ncbi:MAG TPA: hypothetical protein DCZ95_13215 [Verrucomicrobia bacterium]|nr:MAG: hypothetical protein A2X46_11460 [Lentisphaerae bacterium GWF2_57_35]HBA85046.1 hypothetical protein [Verrucomicrobiota bacterium]
MRKPTFEQALEQILKEDRRYHEHAYEFLREGLDFTMKALAKPAEGEARHVSGQELLQGLRRFALQEFGPMAKTVLHRWGITRCEDFGEIVFNLVDKGVLGKNERDSRQDFTGGYDFEEAFRKPFHPARKTERKSITSHKTTE